MKYNQSMFEGVPKKNVNKSRFNRSHEWKGSFNPGQLVVCLLEECMPGDEHDLSSEYMFRMDSLYYPIMVLMTMRADTFWCPNRILWPEGTDTNVGWKRWITEQEEIIPPYMNAEMEWDTTTLNNQVLGFMGIPHLLPGVTKTTVIDNLNAFPLAAYLAIWDEYYRNPLLESERGFPLVAGNNTSSFNTAFGVSDGRWNCLPSKWMMDYLTSAIPTPQLGEAIPIPQYSSTVLNVSTGVPVTDGDLLVNSAHPDGPGGIATSSEFGYMENERTIKDLRLAEVLQSFYERIAKVGTRYRDWMKAFFRDDPEPGVVDVPVLIRSTFGRVQISDVMSTADTLNQLTEQTAGMTGDYRGNAGLYEPGRETIRYNCKEHGFMIQILQVNPNTSYGQGIHRLWRRSVQQDYPMDIFAGIGDQEILKEEVLYNSITTQLSKNGDTFGYIPYGSEMRHKNNIHVGWLNFNLGRSTHLGRIWDIDQISNYDDLEIDADFVTASSNVYSAGNGGQRLTDVFRSLPVTPDSTTPTKPVITAHIFHSHYVNRNLPVFSTPGKGI